MFTAIVIFLCGLLLYLLGVSKEPSITCKYSTRKLQLPQAPANLPPELKNSNDISQITNSIWISNVTTSYNYPLLKSLGIKQILTIGKELRKHDTNQFTTKYISLDDVPNENISQHFDDTYKFIDAGPTLVHCAMGKSRSVTIVLAYLMRKRKLSLKDALRLVYKKRPIISPNMGFLKQLSDYEKTLS